MFKLKNFKTSICLYAASTTKAPLSCCNCNCISFDRRYWCNCLGSIGLQDRPRQPGSAVIEPRHPVEEVRGMTRAGGDAGLRLFVVAPECPSDTRWPRDVSQAIRSRPPSSSAPPSRCRRQAPPARFPQISARSISPSPSSPLPPAPPAPPALPAPGPSVQRRARSAQASARAARRTPG